MKSSGSSRGVYAVALAAILVTVAGCSGKGPHGSHMGLEDSGLETDGTTVDSGATDGAADTGAHDAAVDTHVPPTDTGPAVDMGTTSDPDGFAASRTACINEINKLRATQSLTAYTLIDDAAVDTCVDDQAAYDEKADSPHDAWINSIYPTCNGNAQDECEGYGTTPSAIVACLDSMWAEQDNANCKGCVGCTAFGGMCPDCDFYGTMGPECGHYVNMSAVYFTKVACGFAPAPGTWAAQNFE